MDAVGDPMMDVDDESSILVGEGSFVGFMIGSLLVEEASKEVGEVLLELDEVSVSDTVIKSELEVIGGALFDVDRDADVLSGFPEILDSVFDDDAETESDDGDIETVEDDREVFIGSPKDEGVTDAVSEADVGVCDGKGGVKSVGDTACVVDGEAEGSWDAEEDALEILSVEKGGKDEGCMPEDPEDGLTGGEF